MQRISEYTDSSKEINLTSDAWNGGWKRQFCHKDDECQGPGATLLIWCIHLEDCDYEIV